MSTDDGYYDIQQEASELSATHLLVIFSLLLTVELVKGFLKHNKVRWITPAGGCILLGICVGMLMKAFYSDKNHNKYNNNNSGFFYGLDHGVFRTLLLPPIIFEAALSADKTQLRKRRLPVLLFAVVGTLLSALLITFMVYISSAYIPAVPSLSIMQCLLFGSVVSSVDPVTILSVLKSVQVPETELIYVLLLGESLFNDGIAVAMVDAIVDNFHRSGKVGNSASLFWRLVSHFLINTTVSIAIGVITGICSLLFFWSLKNTIHPPMEVVCFFLWALIPHYLGEIIPFANGIVSVATMAIFCDLYISGNQRFTDTKDDDVDDEHHNDAHDSHDAVDDPLQHEIVIITQNDDTNMDSHPPTYSPDYFLPLDTIEHDHVVPDPRSISIQEPPLPSLSTPFPQNKVVFNLKALEYSEYLYDSQEEEDYDDAGYTGDYPSDNPKHRTSYVPYVDDDMDSVNAAISLPTYATQNILFGKFKYRMSSEAEENVRFVAYIISQLAENSIFIGMGVLLFTQNYQWDIFLVLTAILSCLISRVFIVLLLSNLVYIIHYQSQICCPLYDQRDQRYVSEYVTALRDRSTRLVLILAGVRGAVSLALVESSPSSSFVLDYDEMMNALHNNNNNGGGNDNYYTPYADGDSNAEDVIMTAYSTYVSMNQFLPMLRAMTTGTVLFSIFVLGGSSYKIFKRLGVFERQKQDLLDPKL